MKLKVKDLIASREALYTLERIGVPAKAAYVIARNARKTSAELEIFDETRKKLLETYKCKVNEDGSVKYPSKDAEAKVQEEFEQLINTEVELDIRTLSSEDLGNALIPPGALFGVWWMMEDHDG